MQMLSPDLWTYGGQILYGSRHGGRSKYPDLISVMRVSIKDSHTDTVNVCSSDIQLFAHLKSDFIRRLV